MNGVGIDALDVTRMAGALERHPALLERLFTAHEQESSAGNPERLAARFCAKEATMKALGAGIGAIGWHDVEVRRAESGAPTLVVSERAARLAAQRGVSGWHVSLTHTATMAMAVVVAEH